MKLLSVAKCCIVLLIILASLMPLYPIPVYAATQVMTITGEGTFDPTGGTGGDAYFGGTLNWDNLNSDDGDTERWVFTSGCAAPNTIGDKTWNTSNFATGFSEIQSIKVTYKIRSDDFFGKAIYPFVYIGGVKYYGTTITHATTSYASYETVEWSINPNTGAKWGATTGILEYDNAEFGGTFSTGCNSVYLTYMFVTITYSPIIAPSVTTVAASSIAPTSATLNGNITSDGGDTITDYGFGWGTVSQVDPGSATGPNASGYAAKWEVGAGVYTEGAISHATGATLTANTTYYFRAAAKNSIGWSWGSELSFKTIGIPVGTTQPATNVVSTTARLNSNVSDQNGQLCDVRFGYGTTTQANVAAYDVQTAWVENIYATGSNPYVDVTGLVVSTPYFFRVAIRNDAGTVEGSELTFTTTSGVNQPTSITAIPSSTTINLSWVKSSASNTWIRYAEGAYPIATNAGTLTYSGTGSSYELTGLTPGKSYFFSAWGLTGGVYSAAYTTVLSTTSAYSLPTGTPTTTNTTPVTITPSSLKLSSTPIVGPVVTSFSTSYNMGETYIWYFLWFMAGAGLFIILYNITHQNDIISGLVTAAWFGLGTAQELVGLVAMVIILIVWASTSIVGRNRV